MNPLAVLRKLRVEYRRSKRLSLRVAVRVCGRTRNKNAFHEETHTLSVNAHGALVILTARVELGQTILLVNKATQEEQECRVVHVGPTADGKTKVGFAFKHTAPNFWHINFPPIAQKPLPE